MITRQDCERVARELDLPPIVQGLAQGRSPDFPLDIFFRAVDLSEEDQTFGSGTVVPLWDDGNFDHIVGYHIPSRSFVRFHIEDGFDERTALKMNWQQILLGEFRRLYEAEFMDDRFHETARQFHFEHADEIIAAYESLSHDQIMPWFESKLRELGS